jgi:nicotinate-nucleotide adenylyltransferase
MRIGVFGGTFDPPHRGHLALAESALNDLHLDEILFVPAHRNPLKQHSTTTLPAQRLEMTRRLATVNPKFAVSDLELSKGGVSYAVDTLSDLTYVKPGEYWFLLGADAARSIADWKQPQRLVRLARLAVALRPPYSESQVLASIPPEFHSAIDFITMPPSTLSSSDIRSMVSLGRSITPLVTPEVERFIRENGLYKSE